MAATSDLIDGDVRPLAGAGIEMNVSSLRRAYILFAPSRGRELKFEMYSVLRNAAWFAPSRGRELKSLLGHLHVETRRVRPLAGAGIEIKELAKTQIFVERSPPRGGGN